MTTNDPTSTAPQSRLPLRVAYCIDNMNLGGTELNAVRTAPHLLAEGVDLRVFSLAEEGPLLARYASLGVPVHFLPISSLYGRSALNAGRRLTALIQQHQIHVVHAHDFYSNIFAGPWVRLAGAGFVASRRWWEGPDQAAQRWANRLSYCLAHRVLANSPSIAALMTEREKVPKARVAVVPNFLDPPSFDPPPAGWTEAWATDLGLPSDRMVVGVVANLSPVKDHALLLRAVTPLFPEWPTLYVVLVGADAGSREALERQARELGVEERLRFAGQRPNLPSPHHLFDISVLTSRSEGLPNSILEAMAAGRPVVATRVGAVADAVRDGTTGYLIPPGSADELRSRLAGLLGDADLRHRLGAAGRQVAEQEYVAAPAISRLMQTYRAVATRGGRALGAVIG